MKRFTFIIILITLFNTYYYGQIREHNLDSLIITAGRVPTSFSELSRSVTIISKKELEAIPASSVQEALQYIGGVDVRQRSINGIQADVSIRGGSFEQVLVLINGVRFNNPQTGHHNMNIPFTLNDIERIEVLKGQGAKIFGANASGGIINIITKKNMPSSINLALEGGENAFYNANLATAYNLGLATLRISGGKSKTDGFTDNTDFNTQNFTADIDFKTSLGNINTTFGYNDKKFGANGFYSGNMEWEHTTTKFLNLSGNFGTEHFLISPKLFFTRGDDDYIWNRKHPEWYRNHHTTKSMGAELQATYYHSFGVTSFGAQYTTDSLNSNRLGLRKRENKGLFLEHKFNSLKDFSVNIGAFAHHYSEIGWKLSPGIDMAYTLNQNIRIYGSLGKAFRVPTYTELYYLSKDTKGNPNLKYEETLNYEIGMAYSGLLLKGNISFFRKEGKNNIDWVAEYISSKRFWIAENFAEVNTNGIEINFTANQKLFASFLPQTTLSLSYIYLNSDKFTGKFLSRDYLEHLKHQAIMQITSTAIFGITQTWAFRYEKREHFGDLFLMDLKLIKKVEGINLYLDVSNLLDRKYRKHLYAELPGRWIKIGAKYQLNF